MKLYLAGAFAVALSTMILAAACGGGASGPEDEGTPSPTVEGTSVRSGATAALIARLDSIGVSIGAVPDDVRVDLLDQCRALEAVADRDRVDEICRGINEAIQQGDPGKMELVLNRLAELETE